MKNKVAIIHNLPPGGGRRMMEEIIKRYRYKCDIDIYSLSTERPKTIKRVSLNWFKLSPWKGFILFNLWIIFILPRLHKNIAKKINWTKYDLVFVTHDYFTKSPYILRYIKSSNIVYLCQEAQREFYEPSEIHAPYLKDKIANILRYPIKWIDEKNVIYAKKIICNSKYSKITLQKIYNKNCEIVYPGVDRKSFYPGNKKKEDLIISIGGINKVKGQEFIVNSLRSILNKYKLVLIGSGREVDLKRIIKLIGNANVEIVNNINDETILNYYQKAKVTCLAAYYEPFGLSAIESQACGTPVVALDQGGPKETIINNSTGYLAKYSKNNYLAKVKKALFNYKNLGNNGLINTNKNWLWIKTLKPLDKYFLQ